MKRFSSTVQNVIVIVMIFAVISSFLFFPDSVAAQSEENSTNLCVLQPSSLANFPELQISFRAYDAKTFSVPQNLLSDQIMFVDNGQEVAPRTLSAKKDLGLNMIFVVDQGNRTNSTTMKAVIQRFVDRYMIDGLDRVTIFSSVADSHRSNPWLYLKTTSAKSDVQLAVADMKELSVWATAYTPYTEAISMIRADNLSCKMPTMIVMLMGKEEIDTQQIKFVVGEAISAGVPVHVVNIEKDTLGNQDEYRKIAKETGGIYQEVARKLPQEFTVLDQPFFNVLIDQRTRYEAAFRSPTGALEHVLSVNWIGTKVETELNTTRFSISLSSPILSISTPVEGLDLKRTALRNSETGYIYDVDAQLVQFQVSWSDNKPRKIKVAELILTTSSGTNTVATMNPSDGQNLEFMWDLRDFKLGGQNDVSIQVRVVDEYGFEGLSNPINMRVTNVIPLNADNVILKYAVYGLGVIVVILLILVIIFWRKVNTFISSGAIGKIVENVRKTIVGAKKKTLAILVVLEGPQRLIGKELKVQTESVTLGRDPNEVDFTFYADSNSSISRMHSRVERSNGQWRLVGISKSGNETFLDDEAIPNFEPRPIHTGQRIRMGYEGQQPVELEFREVNGSSSETPGQDRKTKVKRPSEFQSQSGVEFDFDQSDNSTQEIKKDSEKSDDIDKQFENFRHRQ